jgi:RNA polymerase sigma factor (sigma-70 family)
MSDASLHAAVDTARRAALAPLTDGELLSNYIAARDQTSFTNLVHRLGPMVLAVCRREVGDAHLAEDAFQAAFIVLARRAGDVRPREAVRGWLYGVAVRTGLRARAQAKRRRCREVTMANPPEIPVAPDTVCDAETLRALDEEIARLPEFMRATVVLCELGGTSRSDAAQRLGVPEGTVSSRLNKGRKLLLRGLRRRGITLTIAGLTTLLAQSVATAAVPAELAEATVGVALAQAAAGSATPSVVPSAVAALASSVFRAMLLQRITSLALGIALVSIGSAAAGGAVWAIWPLLAPPPAPAGLHGIFMVRDHKLYLMDTDGKNEGVINLPEGADPMSVSPDGRLVAYVIREDAQRSALYVGTFNTDAPALRFDLPDDMACWRCVWAPDGRCLHLNLMTDRERQFAALDMHYAKRMEQDKVIKVPSTGLEIRRVAEGWACQRWNNKLRGTFPDLLDAVRFATQPCSGRVGDRRFEFWGHYSEDMQHYRIDLTTRSISGPLKAFDGHVVIDWLPDGKRFLTSRGDLDADRSLWLTNLDGSKHKRITNLDESEHKRIRSGDGHDLTFGRLSPDGKHVFLIGDHQKLLTDVERQEFSWRNFAGIPKEGVAGVNLGRDDFEDFPAESFPTNWRYEHKWPSRQSIEERWAHEWMGFDWSPYSQRIVYTVGGRSRWHVIISDPDGGNPRAIRSEKNDYQLKENQCEVFTLDSYKVFWR